MEYKGGKLLSNDNFTNNPYLKVFLIIAVFVVCGYGWTRIMNVKDAAKFSNPPFLVQSTERAHSPAHLNNRPNKICPMFNCGTCGMGNLIFQFASALGISLHLNMKLIITEQDIFNQIFQIKGSNTSIEIHKNRNVCNNMKIVTEQYGCCTYDKRFTHLNSSRDYRIGNYLHSWKYFQGYESEIRKHLIFKNDIQEVVEKTMTRYLHKHNLTSRSIVVGIHVRRGDMIIPKKVQRGYNVAPTEYFLKAITFLSSKLNDTILFIIATNDKQWVTNNIVLNKRLTGYKFEMLNNRQPEIDFAILASCDHVITSVGTFGWWAAWLANGITTYYKWPARPNTFVGNQYSKNFTDFFYPHWFGFS